MKSKHVIDLEQKIGELNNTILSHARRIKELNTKLEEQVRLNKALRLKYRNPEHIYKELMRARALCGRYYDKYGRLEEIK